MKSSEDRFREMIDAIPAMAWSSLPDGSVEIINRRWLDFTGLTLDEALGWGWTAAVHPDDLNHLIDRWRALLASGQSGARSKHACAGTMGNIAGFCYVPSPCATIVGTFSGGMA